MYRRPAWFDLELQGFLPTCEWWSTHPLCRCPRRAPQSRFRLIVAMREWRCDCGARPALQPPPQRSLLVPWPALQPSAGEFHLTREFRAGDFTREFREGDFGPVRIASLAVDEEELLEIPSD